MKMPGGWITGADVMQEHGVLAIEIGQACYDGKLHAYTETGTAVLEKTKLAHVPIYLPAGADQLDHIQYTHSPEWDWPGTEVNRARLYYLLAVEGGALGEATRRISEEARERYERLGLVSIEDKDRDAYRKRASFDILPVGIDQPSAPFCFRFEDFIAWLNNSIDEARARFADWPERFMRRASGGQLATGDEFFFQYESIMKILLFQRSEVDAWLQLPPAGQEGAPLSSVHPGSRKDKARIGATRQACEEVRKEIEQGEHLFEVPDKDKTNLKHNYKTNYKTFLEAVSNKLTPMAPHKTTAREEWKKVPARLKHIGRVPVP